MKISIKNVGFGSPRQNAAGKVEMNNFKPGDQVEFGLGLDVDGFQNPKEAPLLAKVWTNIGNSKNPNSFYEVPMEEILPGDQHQRAFKANICVNRLGTYKATAMISEDFGKTWQYINQFGTKDVVIRPKVAAWDGLNIREVNIGKANASCDSNEYSTIEDMIDDTYGNYNLKSLQSQGINALWIQCPFRADAWDKRHASDSAGSPYAVTDYFSIDPRLSREATKIPAGDIDAQRHVANQAMKNLIDKAHSMGIKVFFCIAPNHVGHNYIFRDLIKDSQDNYTIARNDYSLMMSKDDAKTTQDKFNTMPNYAEYINPKMYAACKDGHYDPKGAHTVHETMHDTWYGDWADTKKLNHGAFAAHGIHQASTPENQYVLDYLGRIMFHAVTFLGVDGFRIDHTTGMPDQFFFETLPKLQADVDDYRGQSSPVFMMSEDHDRKNFTAQVSDLVQSKWYEQIQNNMLNQNAEGFFSVVESPYFQELIQTGNHDEHRAIHTFAGDMMAYGRYICTMQLYGKSFSMLMGDEYGEAQKMHFLAYGGIPVLNQAKSHSLPSANVELATVAARAGHLKTSHPSLNSGISNRLYAKDSHPPIIAFARHGYEESSTPVLVFSNLSNQYDNGCYFGLDNKTVSFIEEAIKKNSQARFQVRDLMSNDPTANLWSTAKSAQELLEQGLCALLKPYQVQALELLITT